MGRGDEFGGAEGAKKILKKVDVRMPLGATWTPLLPLKALLHIRSGFIHLIFQYEID
jgi:hypothetical protein